MSSEKHSSETKETHIFQVDPFGDHGKNGYETTITDEKGSTSAVGWTSESSQKAASEKHDAKK